MSNAEPVEGKCNATARNGGFCGSNPAKGGNGSGRCRMHGGTTQGVIQHGLHSAALRLRYSDPKLRRRLEEIIDDPNLLDVRRPAALSQLAIEGLPLEPRREDGERLALAILTKKLKDGEELPVKIPEQAIQAALHELRAIYAERAVSTVNGHARTVAIAARQEKVAEILVRGAMPIMRRFAERVAGLVRKYLPPSKQSEFLLALKTIIEETQLEIVKFGEEADSGAKR